MAGSIQKHFGNLHDPRDKAGRRHSLPAMITLAICAIICGSDGWTDIEEFGVAKRGWFKTFLDLPHGIPSHDTLGRVFAALKPEAFERCFNRWVKGLVKAGKGGLVAMRGHWGVENPLHSTLDVVFKEDGSRVRKGHGAENLSRWRRIALNTPQREKSKKRGIRAKRLKTGWDHDYLLTLLQT